MEIALPAPIPLCVMEQLALLDKVPERTAAAKERRANFLLSLDRAEEALAELSSIPAADRNAGTNFSAALAHLQIGGEDAINRAQEILTSIDTEECDTALAFNVRLELADIRRKRGNLEDAARQFRSLLAEHPGSRKALRKLAVSLIDLGRPDEVLAACEDLLGKGIHHPRMLGTYLAALAALGREDEANAVRAFDSTFRQTTLDMDGEGEAKGSFNEALCEELLAHPALRFGNSRQASHDSWRVDELMVRSPPMAGKLLRHIARELKDHVARLQRLDQTGQSAPFFKNFPAKARMVAWAIIARAKGHEGWHTHDKGWLSGVYYAAVPKGVPRGKDEAGAIEFGWPERLLGEGASQRLGNRIIHPEEGMLLLFPSHIHHRTYPHGMDEDRICVSFDLVPG